MSDVSVQVTVRLRNAALIDARKRLGYSQKKLHAITGVPLYSIWQLEKFNLSGPNSITHATTLADTLDIELDTILPPDMRGKSIQDTVTSVETVDTTTLLALGDSSSRFILPSPADAAEHKDSIAQIAEITKTALTFFERGVIGCRYGLQPDGSMTEPMTLHETGKKFQISRERVRQVEIKAMRKLKEAVVAPKHVQWPEADPGALMDNVYDSMRDG